MLHKNCIQKETKFILLNIRPERTLLRDWNEVLSVTEMMVIPEEVNQMFVHEPAISPFLVR